MRNHLKVIGKRFRGKDGTIINWTEHPTGLIEISASDRNNILVHLPFSNQFRDMAQVTFEELIDRYDAKLLKRR